MPKRSALRLTKCTVDALTVEAKDTLFRKMPDEDGSERDDEWE